MTLSTDQVLIINLNIMTNTFQNFLRKNEKVIGTIASILAIIMFVSLIEILRSNFSGKSDIIIQPLATTVNCFFWSLYAYGKKDWFLFVPNALGLVLGVITALSALA
jgi:uncharacterized protein with PQ loop repeat